MHILQQPEHRLHRRCRIFRAAKPVPQRFCRVDQPLPELLHLLRIPAAREGLRPPAAVHAVSQRVVLQPMRFLRRHIRKSALRHVQHVRRGISACNAPQRAQQQTAQAMPRRAVLAGDIMRDPGAGERHGQDSRQRSAARHRHGHALPRNPCVMPAAEGLGDIGSLRIRVRRRMDRNRTAVPVKGRALPGEQVPLQMLQGRVSPVTAQRQIAPFHRNARRPHALHELRGAMPLRQENPAVRHIPRIHRHRNGHRCAHVRALRQQIAHLLRDHVKAVDENSRAVHHAAWRKPLNDVSLLHRLVGEAAVDHPQVFLPHPRHIQHLRLQCAGIHMCSLFPQRLRRHVCALQIGHQNAQLVWQTRRQRDAPVVGQLPFRQRQRL